MARTQMESTGQAVADVYAKLRMVEDRLGAAADITATVSQGLAGAQKTQTPETSAQIEALLDRLGKSRVTWASAEGDKPLFMLYAIVAAKYGMVKSSIGGPEEFISRVANADLLGKPLNVTEPDGTTISLQEWFRREFGKMPPTDANGSLPAESAATVRP